MIDEEAKTIKKERRRAERTLTRRRRRGKRGGDGRGVGRGGVRLTKSRGSDGWRLRGVFWEDHAGVVRPSMKKIFSGVAEAVRALESVLVGLRRCFCRVSRRVFLMLQK